MSDTAEVFERAPVPNTVLKNAIPAMAAMLMVLIYNLADTFFIGQTHNDILVAAVQALIINLSRQGIIYIPALFLLQAVLEGDGLAWAQPVADLLSTALVAALYLWTSRKRMAEPCGDKI